MDENELKIVSEISKKSDASQRHLSKAADLSLGMVNIILHRLIEKGYMKIKQLDGRRVQYILTPKGFAEKVDRSKHYLKKTILNVSLIKETIKKRVEQKVSEGKRRFYILGGGELADFIDIAFRELSEGGVSHLHIRNLNEASDRNGVIILTEGFSGILPENGRTVVDLSKELAEVLV